MKRVDKSPVVEQGNHTQQVKPTQDEYPGYIQELISIYSSFPKITDKTGFNALIPSSIGDNTNELIS